VTPTGRSIEVEKIREKLEKAKSIEEKRLIVESLWRYVEFLRELYREARNEARTYLYALLIVIPLGLAQYTASLMFHAAVSYVSNLYLKLMFTMIAIAAVCLLSLIVTRVRIMVRIEKEIYELYNIMIDPAMVRLGGWGLIIAATVLAAIAVMIAVLAWTTL